jgi:hypothetical protein
MECGGVLIPAAGRLSLLALWHFTDNHDARALTSGFNSAAKALTEHQGNADVSQTTGDALTKHTLTVRSTTSALGLIQTSPKQRIGIAEASFVGALVGVGELPSTATLIGRALAHYASDFLFSPVAPIASSIGLGMESSLPKSVVI